jgi:hypothetical protein
MQARKPSSARVDSSPRHLPTLKKAAMAGALMCALVSGNAAAIFGVGDVVIDPTAIAKQIAEFAEQAKRWEATARQYKQQLISLGGLSFNPTKLNAEKDTLPYVDPEYGLEDACRKKSGDGPLGAISSIFAPDANEEILGQQLEICKRIVRAENLKYNETVRYLRSLRDRQADLQKIDDRRDSVGTEQGKLQALSYDIERYQQNSKMDLDNWQAMITAYDSYIAQLNKYQQRLANRALRGKQPDMLSGIVQGVVLKKALDARKEADN